MNTNRLSPSRLIARPPYHAHMPFRPREPLPAHATTLPARYYTDRALFARERDRFDRRLWIAAGRLEDLRTSGDYFLTTIAGDSLIVLRTGAGEQDLRAFFNLCRH